MIERLIALKSRALAWLLGVPLAPRVVAPPGYSVQACNAVGYSAPARTWRDDALPRRVFVEDLGHRTRRAARWYRIFRDVGGRPFLVREVVASGDRVDIYDVPDPEEQRRGAAPLVISMVAARDVERAALPSTPVGSPGALPGKAAADGDRP